ncbi:CPBP family glutamic-type intramembrane protease [Marinitoga lauensis]|uniref:CPBP family glutamic-type intramembrane protease n=1 Tax=Marinitoga lauensis TaxID=2201189 RepID=UPI001011E260
MLNELLLNIINNIVYVSLISSLAFALIHIFNLLNGIENRKYFLITFPLRFAFGLFFSFIYFEYGLLNSIILHFLVDFPALYRIYKK